MELLVAMSLASLMMAAAWAWLFSVTDVSAGDDARSEVESRLGFAHRLITGEVTSGTLVADPVGSCTRTCLTIAVTRLDNTSETIVYRYDQSRSILWRKSSGSHVAEGVRALSFEYLSADGEPLALGEDDALAPALAASVRAVRLAMTLAVRGAAPHAYTWTMPLTW